MIPADEAEPVASASSVVFGGVDDWGWLMLLLCVLCVSKLCDFSDSLQDPLRVPHPNASRLAHMDLPLYPGDKVHRTDVLLTLAKQATSPPALTPSVLRPPLTLTLCVCVCVCASRSWMIQRRLNPLKQECRSNSRPKRFFDLWIYLCWILNASLAEMLMVVVTLRSWGSQSAALWGGGGRRRPLRSYRKRSEEVATLRTRRHVQPRSERLEWGSTRIRSPLVTFSRPSTTR